MISTGRFRGTVAAPSGVLKEISYSVISHSAKDVVYLVRYTDVSVHKQVFALEQPTRWHLFLLFWGVSEICIGIHGSVQEAIITRGYVQASMFVCDLLLTNMFVAALTMDNEGLCDTCRHNLDIECSTVTACPRSSLPHWHFFVSTQG